jgi:hypothetical protein
MSKMVFPDVPLPLPTSPASVVLAAVAMPWASEKIRAAPVRAGSIAGKFCRALGEIGAGEL